MTRNNNQKLRAVFLAALMVLWVFAGTVAFAGGAAAADTTTDVVDIDGTEYFQGQEVNFTVGNAAGVSTDDSVQIREVTGRTDGNASTSVTRISEDVDADGNITVDTSALAEGEYVIRKASGTTGFIDRNGDFQAGTLRDMDPRAAEFSIVVQDLSVEFDDDEVRAGQEVEISYSSPVRPSGYSVNVTEADENLDAGELESIFNDLETEGVVGGIDQHPDEDRIMLTGVDSSFEEDVTFPADIDEGDYEFEFEVVDTTAEDTASITVLEEVDAGASFDQGTYSQTRGDIVEISGTIDGNADEVNLTIGDLDDDGYRANVTVEPNDDDEFTVLFNTRNAGIEGVTGAFPDDIDQMSGNIFGTAEDQGEVTAAEQEGDITAILERGNYDLYLHGVDTHPDDFGDYDIATMSLTERSTDSIQLWRAPENMEASDFEDLEDIEAAVEEGTLTQTDVVTHRSGRSDIIVHQIGVSGVQGEGTDADQLLNKSANEGTLSIEYEQLSPSSNRRAMELNYSATNFDNFEVILDRDNDVLYAIADVTDLRVSRGTHGDQGEVISGPIPNDESYEVRYNVSANYLNLFERDNPYDVGADEDDEIVSQDLDIEERELEFDTLNDDIVVPPTEDAEISGTTNIAPGTEFDIRAQGSGDNAFLRTGEDVVVNEDGSFVGMVDMSDIDVDTEFDATVRQQGFEDNAEQSGVVQESDGAVFAVSNLDPEEAEVMQGDTITVSATITNEGDQSGTQTVALTIDGNEVATEEVELDAGDDTTVEFSDVDTSELDEGDYEHAIQTDDDSASGTLTITVEDGGDDDSSADDSSADDSSADDSSADDSSADDSSADDGETEDQPGFGAVIALIALLGAALLAARRNN